MIDDAVAQIRRFNRAVTERVGALSDQYMGRDRPLGEARLLWQIGPDGSTVARLRARLELDSGYASRLLRALEADGLVEVVRDSQDGRSRIARLTERGREERATLDARSDELARSLLSPLSASQQDRLVTAMGEVERLLTVGMVQIIAIDPEHEDALSCLGRYTAELNQRSDRTFDPAVGATVRPDDVRPPAGEFFVAYLHGEPIGCGAVKHHPDAPAEIKRMWIARRARGLGLGRRLLETLEACAEAGGARVVHIETSAVLTEAHSLYRSTGWVEVPPFNDEPFADHWLEKELA
jgi:DNA-binding MarR family transcriptional regulator/GNAT superfamily N-acetyltransferase